MIVLPSEACYIEDESNRMFLDADPGGEDDTMITVALHDNWSMMQIGADWRIPAAVPGSVYGDLLQAGKMEDPFWKDNEIKALALMDEDYEYQTVFDCSGSLLSSDAVLLRFEGLDTIADIFLNDVELGHADNMHRIWEYSVKDILKENGNKLCIRFHSPTKFIAEAFQKAPTLGTEDAMNGFVHIRKAHCMFGWDWGAHLPDAGIWRPVYLLGIDTARLDSVQIFQYHENGIVRLKVCPEIDWAAGSASRTEDLQTEVSILAPDGKAYRADTCEEEIVIEDPALWWPNGYGKQNLYRVTVALKKQDGTLLDTWEKRIGLRTITMDRTKDKWGERFAVCVNGMNIFSMGADYIPEDHLLGRVTEETTRDLLEKAVFANFNSIRVWGGGYYPDDWFYDICDELGLVVWQDFMFACAVYDLTEEFEKNIRAEFKDNIKRLRHHASLGLMCGNNEMEQFVSERCWVTKESEVQDYLTMYEKILPEMMQTYAPQVFYWPASPSSGGSFDDPRDENRGDVHYWEVWHGNKPFSEYRKFHFRYLSEFGFQSFPAKKTVETFTDDERDMNIFSYIMERHQRNGSANGKIMNYMQQMYQYPTDFETLIYASQLLQADAIRYGAEHFRRNRNEDRCMGTVYWQLNDCWPVASWSSIDYCHRLKALHYYARRFFAPILISCEEEGMMGSGQELVRLPFEFPKSIRLNVTNETLEDEKITIRWQVREASTDILEHGETELLVPALTSVWLEKRNLPDIDIYRQYVSYQAYKGDEPVSEGTVIFSYPKYFRYEDPALTASVNGKYITVTAKSYAKSVEIQNEDENLVLSDNYFDMNGGVKTVEILSGAADHLRLRSVYDIH